MKYLNAVGSMIIISASSMSSASERNVVDHIRLSTTVKEVCEVNIANGGSTFSFSNRTGQSASVQLQCNSSKPMSIQMKSQNNGLKLGGSQVVMPYTANLKANGAIILSLNTGDSGSNIATKVIDVKTEYGFGNNILNGMTATIELVLDNNLDYGGSYSDNITVTFAAQ